MKVVAAVELHFKREGQKGKAVSESLHRYDCPRCTCLSYSSEARVAEWVARGQCGGCDNEDEARALVEVIGPVLEEQRADEVKKLLDQAASLQLTSTYDLMDVGLDFTPEHPRWAQALKLLVGGRSGTRYAPLVEDGKVFSIHLHRHQAKASWAWQIRISCDGPGYSGSEWYITHEEVRAAFS